MAHDYEDLHNIDELDDSEVVALVREQLRAHEGLDVDDITVNASSGRVILSGRVGTDEERRIAEHVLTDVLGVQDFKNDLLVDPNFRAEASEDVTAQSDGDSRSDGSFIDAEVPLSDESAHLADMANEDPEGTSDLQKVMEDGMTWNPPDSPTPEGLLGTDAGPEEMGERH